MAKQLLFAGNWCRVIRVAHDGVIVYITETADGTDGLGATRWTGASRNIPECFSELGEEIHRLQTENNNLRTSLAEQSFASAASATKTTNKRR